jgi:hypothetical protein
MANTFKALARGAAATTSTTLYITPALTTTLVSTILIANGSTSNQTYNILLDDVPIAVLVSIPANDSLSIDVKQVLAAGKTIKAFSSSTSVYFHVTGLEIT